MAEQRIERVDDIPLILHWLKKMWIAEYIDVIWTPHGNREGLSYGQLAVLFITYVVHSLNHRLSGMEDWVMKHKAVLQEVTGWEIDNKDATDDRLGAMVGELGGDSEKIIDFQRQTGGHIIQAYELPTELCRYDTTSFNVYHSPEKNDNALLKFGYSKDKRPDLLQFKQGLGVLDPAGIPLFTETVAGNEGDDPLYVPAWREMAKTIGHTDFLYIADSKAGALETRATIDKEKGYYLFPLAMTGKVPEELTSAVLNPPAEVDEITLNDTGGDKEEPAVVGRGFVMEKDLECSEGDDKHTWQERWLIVQSNAHGERQRKGLMDRLEKAEKKLKSLTAKKEESLVEFQGRVEKVLSQYSVEESICVDVKEKTSQRKEYKKRGRPGPNSPYEMVEVRQLELDFHRNESVIEEQSALAGWRVYVTNTAKERMSLQQSVRYYRDEWRVERGMHRFKRGSLPALPLFLRIPERIKGLMLLLTIALQVLTLMEFVIRRELAKRGETLSGLVPGNPKMKTARPTAERILSQFKELNCLIEEKEGRVIGSMVEALTSLQKHILTLLKVPTDIYDLSFNRPAFREAA